MLNFASRDITLEALVRFKVRQNLSRRYNVTTSAEGTQNVKCTSSCIIFTAGLLTLLTYGCVQLNRPLTVHVRRAVRSKSRPHSRLLIRTRTAMPSKDVTLSRAEGLIEELERALPQDVVFEEQIRNAEARIDQLSSEIESTYAAIFDGVKITIDDVERDFTGMTEDGMRRLGKQEPEVR
jgi:hypothetical protein